MTFAATEVRVPDPGMPPGGADDRQPLGPLDPDPARLWPDLPPSVRLAAHRAIATATAAVLRGNEAPPRLAAEPPVSLRALGVAAFAAGVGPLLSEWIATGATSAAPDVADVLRTQRQRAAERGHLMRQRLVRILDALRAEGVVPTLLKGMHTGVVYFPEPATRPVADIDLLVHPGDADAARSALMATGLEETRASRWARRSEWTPRGATGAVHSVEVEHPDNPWTVDLHTALERWYFRGCWADLGSIAFTGRAEWEVEGRPVWVLAQPVLAVFLALHAFYALYDLRLLRLAELALVLRRDASAGHLRWDDLENTAAATRTGRFIYPAFELVERLVPGTVPRALLTSLGNRTPPRLRRVLDQVVAAGLMIPFHRSLDDRFMWTRGTWENVLCLSSYLWSPDDIFSLSDHLRTYARRMRLLVAGRAHLRAPSGSSGV